MFFRPRQEILLVRLPDTDPTLVRKALDLGVRNVFLPRVETATEVREAVKSARFSYERRPGDRGLGSPRARRWGLADDYVASEDRETIVGVTIETEASVEKLDAILNVPELGFVFIAPLDRSVSLGCPGEVDHPDVREAVETVRSTAVDAGVPVGGLGFGMDDVNEKGDERVSAAEPREYDRRAQAIRRWLVRRLRGGTITERVGTPFEWQLTCVESLRDVERSPDLPRSVRRAAIEIRRG